MSVLKATIKSGNLVENYQKGALRLMSLPVEFGSKKDDDKFFAYLTTLGGGLVDGDNYSQNFRVFDSFATLSSQSNQKIFKGSSSLKTKIEVKNSKLVFYNHANIFYEDANFSSKTAINCDKSSEILYIDGGFLGYAEGKFKASMNFRVFEGSKIMLNDTLLYESPKNINLFYENSYFYTIIAINSKENFKPINENSLKVFSSRVKNLDFIRVLSTKNDLAIGYIDEILRNFKGE